MRNPLKIDKYSKVIEEVLSALKCYSKINSIVLYGSYNKGSFIEGWSDIDLMVVLKDSLSKEEFIKIFNEVSDLKSNNDIKLSINLIKLSEVQVPTFGKPLIYLKELKEGKVIYGKSNPFINCFMPDTETIRQNSIKNLKTIVGDARRLIRKIGNKLDVKEYKKLLRYAIKYSTFSIKRACEIKTSNFFMTQTESLDMFGKLFPNKIDEAKTILSFRERWIFIENDKEILLEKISLCVSFVEDVWSQIYKEIMSKTKYSSIEKYMIARFSKLNEFFGTNYRLEHTFRVYNMCNRLKTVFSEYDIDEDVLLISALLHDINKSYASSSMEDNLLQITQVIENRVTEKQLAAILHLLVNYKKYIKSKDPNISIETKILVDAYILDKIGYAGGVTKTLIFGEAMGRSVGSSIKYYFDNLSDFDKYKDKLYLDSSKRIAEERNNRTKEFWNRLKEEYDGNK